MPTFTGSMDASLVYASVRIMTRDTVGRRARPRPGDGLFSNHICSLTELSSSLLHKCSVPRSRSCGPCIGPLHLKHKMAATKLNHKLSAAAISCFKSQRVMVLIETPVPDMAHNTDYLRRSKDLQPQLGGLAPLETRCARVSSITTTRAPVIRSWSVKKRPRINGMPMVWRYPGDVI
jgi:hypothetical protein